MELFKLAGTILIEAKEAIDSLHEVSDEAKKTGKNAEKMGEDFKDGGKATENSLEEIAQKSGKTADEVKKDAEKLAKKYEEAGDDSETAMKKAFAEMKKDSSKSTKSMSLDFDKVAKAAAGVVSAIIAAAEAIVALAESSREYRVEMSKLETAFATAGHSADSATATYRTLYSVLGETDQAVEAANMLARLCDSEEQLAEMTNACIGAYATFGNSLPVEGLAEAANETAKTGTLTGQLADALNWMGVSEDEFNEKLSKCNTERERAVLISKTLNDLYGEATEVYLENNKAITEAYLAQEQLNADMAEFGEKAEYVAAKWADLKRWGLYIFGSYLESFDKGKLVMDAYSAHVEKVRSIGEEFGKAVATPFAEMANATAEAADAIAEAEATAYAKASAITTQYVADAQALFEQFAATYEGIYSKVSGFFDPFEKASVSVQTNVTKMMEAMQSQIDFNNKYADNLQKLKEYGLGALAEEFQAYGAEGSAYANAIVDAVEKAGGAHTEEAQKIIQNFTAMNEKVAESQGELTETMALMSGEFETEMNNLVDKFGVAIEGLDKSAEAKSAAMDTFDAFLQGMNSKTPGILETMKKFGEQIKDAMSNGMGGMSFTITPIFDPEQTPGHEDGLNFVPYDNYLAYLHHGEAVLTAEEAAAWRAGKKSASGGDPGSGGGFVVNQYIESVPLTPAELASATAAYFEQARWVT